MLVYFLYCPVGLISPFQVLIMFYCYMCANIIMRM